MTAPKTWDEFKAALKTIADKGTKPLGLGTGPDTWTLTDWFESIYLRQAGATSTTSSSPASCHGPIRPTEYGRAFDTMKEALNDNYVAGGITAANGRAWVDGIAQVFGDKPVADMSMDEGLLRSAGYRHWPGQQGPRPRHHDRLDRFPVPRRSGYRP